MLAMHYRFDLPDSFDMQAIRQRVAAISGTFDRLPGLYCKAFLITDRRSGGSNSYAPFYLWRDAPAMTGFLRSEAFRALVQKFGRPAVRCWQEIAYVAGPAVNDVPVLATLEQVPVAPEADLDRATANEIAACLATAQAAGLHSRFVGLDAEGWRWLRFTLWRSPPAVAHDGQVFEVLHLSSPGTDSR